MRVAVFGSIESKSVVREFSNVNEFGRCCHGLGQALCKGGHKVIIESDRDRTADPYIVEGYRSVDSQQATGGVEAWHRTATKLGRHRRQEPFADVDWVVKIPTPAAYVGPAHMMMLRQADVAVVIGGGNNAYLAGQAALASDVRLIPVAAFGGAGQMLWEEVRNGAGASSARSMDPELLNKLGTASLVIEAVREELASLPRIMVVHGRADDSAFVENLLNEAGSTAFRMMNQSAAGETIPQEFERLARTVDGAVVVITPDDIGGVLDTSSGNSKSLSSRARQNVILEYGWFWCRFGRDRVLPLVRGDVELPSDIKGVLHVPYEETSQPWLKLQLERFVQKLQS